MPAGVDRDRLTALLAGERERFLDAHPESGRLHREAGEVLLGGVPMSWQSKWAGPHPVFLATAAGSTLTDVDGNSYVDLCLGDTGAMTGHSPGPTVRAVQAQVERGITTMLPDEDAIVVGRELRARFGLPRWQFTLTATDANRHALRYARHLTGRPKVAVHEWCYHGSVDETFAVLDGSGAVVHRPGAIGPPVPVAETTRVVPFNDVGALRAALAHGDVAAVLMEPALTNVGIVLPDEGYLDAVRALCTEYGALWIVDETHTICAGPGGMTARDGLQPDLVTVGKPLGGGIPCGVFGMTTAVAEAISASVDLAEIDVGGVGGTLAANALSLAAMRATLSEVLTPEAYQHMLPLGLRWADGVSAAITAAGLPWQCTRLGARAEITLTPTAPRDGAEAHAAMDDELDTFLHLHSLNRGVLLTPFHTMALMSPVTTEQQVDHAVAVFGEAATALVG
jgi:glutamate-1-semialdehyde 2,1-aminomutase